MAGFHGLLAPWIGGAGSTAGASPAAGFRGLLAFWAGGACIASGAVDEDELFPLAGMSEDFPLAGQTQTFPLG